MMPVEVKTGRRLQRSDSNGSSVEGTNRDPGEIEEELAADTPRKSISSALSRCNSASIRDVTDETFVAVGKEYKGSKSVLIWALRKSRKTKKFVLLHVHQPSQMIPIMGGWFHSSQLKPEQVEAYRMQEKEKMNKTLDDYMFICEIAKVQAEKLVIQMDDVAKGIVELINQHGITRLVIGAAADKYYSKKMRIPISRTACAVLKDAPPLCKMWFVCKGNLICTREDTVNMDSVSESPHASPSAGYAQSRLSRSRSASQTSGLEQFDHIPRPPADGSSEETTGHLSELDDHIRNGNERHSVSSESGGDKTSVDSSLQAKGDPIPDDDWNIYLQQVLTEAAKLVTGAYKEALRRSRAEKQALEANQRVEESEMRCNKEVELREAVEKLLEQGKLEKESLKSQLENVHNELQLAQKQKLMLNDGIVKYDGLIKDLEEKLSEGGHLLSTIQKERDEAVKEVEQLRQRKEVSSRSTSFLEFSYLELEHATCNFEKSLKIGEGGSGCVYKGYIRHTNVAIKVLNRESLQDRSDFVQEIDNLSRLRHPNLVTLIGACPEAFTLVHEFLSNGSLEDRLSCKDGTPPLSWQIRVRISTEICSALIFLHSNKPQSVVHGDLRPANVLLDANYVCKLSDFSISRLLIQSTNSLYNWTDPKGTFVYLDPEFFSTGEITPQSDIYSFGIILLRLLSGRPALGIVKEVQEALDKGELQKILDPGAGNWPFKHARKLALLGLKCCEMKRKNRPDIIKEVFMTLEPIKISIWS